MDLITSTIEDPGRSPAINLQDRLAFTRTGTPLGYVHWMVTGRKGSLALTPSALADSGHEGPGAFYPHGLDLGFCLFIFSPNIPTVPTVWTRLGR